MTPKLEDSRSLQAVVRPIREAAISLAFRRHGVARVINGVPVRVDPRSRRTFTPQYEPGVADFLRNHLKPGAEVWNVGANVGVWVLQVANWLGGTGRVVAFEPNPMALTLLRSNIRLNGCASQVEVVEMAVGEQPDEVEFFASGADGMGRAGRPNPMLARTDRVSVRVTTLDLQATARGRGPDWILMDIEGWEIAALRGGPSVLETANVVVELHPSAWEWSGHCRADLEHLIEEYDLELIPLAGQTDPLAEHAPVLLRRKSSS